MDKEILADFIEEANQLIAEIIAMLETLEDVPAKMPEAEINEFAIKIDRIMGAAKTLALLDSSHTGLKTIGEIAATCKSTGYKALNVKSLAIIPTFVGFWLDAVEAIESLVECIDDAEKSKSLSQKIQTQLAARLKWLVEKTAA